MKRIFRYPLAMYGKAVVNMPYAEGKHNTLLNAAGQVLHIEMKGGQANAWCVIDEARTSREVTFYTAMTGEKLDDVCAGFAYCGTFINDDGKYVGHVFVRDGV